MGTSEEEGGEDDKYLKRHYAQQKVNRFFFTPKLNVKKASGIFRLVRRAMMKIVFLSI